MNKSVHHFTLIIHFSIYKVHECKTEIVNATVEHIY